MTEKGTDTSVVPERRSLSPAQRYCQDCPAYDGTTVAVENLKMWCAVQNLIEEGKVSEALAIGLEAGKKKHVDGCSPLSKLGEIS
jgi:hypothetical protein